MVVARVAVMGGKGGEGGGERGRGWMRMPHAAEYQPIMRVDGERCVYHTSQGQHARPARLPRAARAGQPPRARTSVPLTSAHQTTTLSPHPPPLTTVCGVSV